MKCGKPLPETETEYCPDCMRREHGFEKGRAAFVYDQLMRASISRFKYHNRREYADFYAEELLRRFGRTLRSWQPDALIPVPIHKSRMRKRGFNQAALVADRIGERLGIPVEKEVLLRVKKTKPQKNLHHRKHPGRGGSSSPGGRGRKSVFFKHMYWKRLLNMLY